MRECARQHDAPVAPNTIEIDEDTTTTTTVVR
jgi:hypothetical protein